MALTVMLAGFLVAPATAATTDSSGCTHTGRYTVCTTDPRVHADGKDLTIVEEIQRRIDATDEGAAIRVAMYEWDLDRVSRDLVDAKARGVDVRVVIGTNDDRPDRNDENIAILRSGGIPVTQCADACLPNGDGVRAGAMHNKFFLISDASGDTVVQTSSNLTVGQVMKHQNLLATTGDAGLYDYYLGYWNRLSARSWTYGGVTWQDADRSRKGDHDLSKAYLFPMTSGDPVVAVLDNVTACRTENEDDRIWVAHSLFERADVRARLVELDTMGCDVKVVVGNTDDEAWLQQPLPGGRLDSGKVRALPGQHNKFIVVDAHYAGEWRKVVFTGSHNATGNSLRNADDVMLRVIESSVVNVYIHYFRDLYL
ncbi:hypothetical protein GCM10023223_13900 [Stackebrandtia albiflava]